MLKIPYLVVIGDKEMASSQLTVESRRGKLENLSLDEFTASLRKEIQNKEQ